MNRIAILAATVATATASCVWAQDASTTQPPLEVIPPAESTQPSEPQQVPQQWTYERQLQNQQGTVTNTHRYLDAPEEGRYVREHVVNNPRGEMTQTWERVRTEDGYEYRRAQTWTSPDGTPSRQHERVLSGTDPNNFTREHSRTFADGRTMSQTQVRSWDGTSGTMERSFTGPNGQTRQSQGDWVPPQYAAPTANMVESTPMSSQASTTPPATSQPASESAWWQKLNPFRKRSSSATASSTTSAPRRGFTVGAPNRGQARNSMIGSSESPSVRGSQNSHRPSWAGDPSRSLRSQAAASRANATSTASRPNVGRGNTR